MPVSTASDQLDVIGKTVPGEAVQTADNQVLADVLRAYGRARDADAARVIVSFANSDRVQVRDAVGRARIADDLPASHALARAYGQPGEVRVCASFHGLNNISQAGGAEPVNTPEALLQLLESWKDRSQGAGTRVYLPLLRR